MQKLSKHNMCYENIPHFHILYSPFAQKQGGIIQILLKWLLMCEVKNADLLSEVHGFYIKAGNCSREMTSYDHRLPMLWEQVMHDRDNHQFLPTVATQRKRWRCKKKKKKTENKFYMRRHMLDPALSFRAVCAERCINVLIQGPVD